MSSAQDFESILRNIISVSRDAAGILEAAASYFEEEGAKSLILESAREHENMARELIGVASRHGISGVEMGYTRAGIRFGSSGQGMTTVVGVAETVVGVFEHARRRTLPDEVGEVIEIQARRADDLFNTLTELPGGSTIKIPIGG